VERQVDEDPRRPITPRAAGRFPRPAKEEIIADAGEKTAGSAIAVASVMN